MLHAKNIMLYIVASESRSLWASFDVNYRHSRKVSSEDKIKSELIFYA